MSSDDEPLARPDHAAAPPTGARAGPDARRRAGPIRGLVAASAALVALGLAAGLHPGRPWLTELLVVAAMVQGLLAGVAWPRFWRGRAREEIFGAGGRFAGFLAAVAFSAVEAYAVGAGMGREETPGAAVAVLLVPPVVAAALALRSAVRHRRRRASSRPATGADVAEGRVLPERPPSGGGDGAGS